MVGRCHPVILDFAAPVQYLLYSDTHSHTLYFVSKGHIEAQNFGHNITELGLCRTFRLLPLV